MLDAAQTYIEIDNLTDWVIGKTLKNLDFYYDETRKIADRLRPPRKTLTRMVLQDELSRALLPLKSMEIMLIAHSMGSIIAYDVLRDIGRTDSDFAVAQFVTTGSPLGLPHVKKKIADERCGAQPHPHTLRRDGALGQLRRPR